MTIQRTQFLRLFITPLLLVCAAVHAASGTPPSGYAYAPNIQDGSISLFKIDAGGKLEALNILDSDSAPRDAAAAGQTLYVVDIWADTLTAFTLDSGAARLHQLGAPLATGKSPETVAIDPLGRFVFVGNGNSDSIQVFRIENPQGELSPIGHFASGAYPTDIAIDPCGRWLYVTHYADHSVGSYAIDPHSGRLQGRGQVAAGNSPAAAVVAPSGDFLYVADGLGSTLSIYRIDDQRGTLKFRRRIAASTYPYALTIDREGRYLYTANFGSNDVTTYALQADGIPLKIGSVAAGIGPFSITLDGSGRHAYVANVRSSSINVYSVEPQKGLLTPLQTRQAEPGTATLELSQAQRHACAE